MRKGITLFFIFVLCINGEIFAQDIEIINLKVAAEEFHTLSIPPATAIALKCDSCTIKGGYFLVGVDTLTILEDPHNPQSALVLLPDYKEDIIVYSGQMGGELRLYFINAGTYTPKKAPNQRLKDTPCNIEPVEPEIWRQGLTAPSYTPGVTDVEHIVIHHSATSNHIDDPYEAVRSIYTYHTQVNGWSDIGYNYLIAPDGTIFQGRDDKEVAEADNIIGAHMCGVNSNTMGVCMLGTFTDVLPTEAALDALALIIKWKTEKEDLPIFGSEVHPIGPPSANVPAQPLPYVCGHRDGCRPSYTECPGDLLYENLAGIKEKASSLDCDSIEEPVNLAVYPNPTTSMVKVDFDWDYLDILDVRGGRLKIFSSKEEEKDEGISIQTFAKGVYIFSFYTQDHGKIVRKVIKL